MRRGTGLCSALTLLAVPVLAACSGDSDDDDVRAAAEAFLGDWAGGDPAAAAGGTDDPDAATALLEQTATDLPEATLTAELGDVEVADDGTATAGWTATWDLAAAPDWSYAATLRLREADDEWQVVAEPSLVHPELAEGQHLELSRSAARASRDHRRDRGPDLHPDRGGQRRRRHGRRHRPAGARRGPLGRHRRRRRGDRRRRPGRPGRAVRAGHRPAPAGLRADPRPGVRPARRGLPDRPPGCSHRASRFAIGPARPRRRRDRRGPRGDQRGRRARVYAAGDQLGPSGLQRAFQEQLTGTPGFTVSVVSTDETTGDEGREVDAVAPVAGEPVQTPLVPTLQNAADAAVAGQPLPTHLVVVRPGHRRDPRGRVQRGGRRRPTR